MRAMRDRGTEVPVFEDVACHLHRGRPNGLASVNDVTVTLNHAVLDPELSNRDFVSK